MLLSGRFDFPGQPHHGGAGVVSQPKTERLQFVQQRGDSLNSTGPFRVQEQAQGTCHLEAERSGDAPRHPIVQDDHGLAKFQCQSQLRFLLARDL